MTFDGIPPGTDASAAPQPPDDFVCRRCGNCCRGEGLVWIQTAEIEGLAACLEMTPHAFTERYTSLAPDRRALTLVDAQDGACVFLEPDNSCRVQDKKPVQCRLFPHFWRYPGYNRICKAMKA